MKDTAGYRRPGASGLKITEINYGNWLALGSQVKADTAAEEILGQAPTRSNALAHRPLMTSAASRCSQVDVRRRTHRGPGPVLDFPRHRIGHASVDDHLGLARTRCFLSTQGLLVSSNG
ncbi:hypothetical protein BKH30_10755 [Actinomyces oris]|uniref:Aldo/keto reductase n=1 Tax=Actinomyces oris TaxID=544580 RepID=A0A1Q8VMV5_9ACTO|nr:hypothetical protein BKH30_10755 [Actinomyces oris]